LFDEVFSRAVGIGIGKIPTPVALVQAHGIGTIVSLSVQSGIGTILI